MAAGHLARDRPMAGARQGLARATDRAKVSRTALIDKEKMQKFTPCLWFDNQAEEAAKFYVSVFKNSNIKSTDLYLEGMEEVTGKPTGSVMLVNFELDGQDFMALNGGPDFKFTEAISFVIDCEDQAEMDEYWDKLTADGGQESMCGWLKDKFGVSWQLSPRAVVKMLADPDPEKAKRVMHLFMKMKKIDIAALQAAYDNN